MNQIRIESLDESEKENNTQLSSEEFRLVVDKNRDRIRGLASLIVEVSGLLLSASLVVLFFTLKEGVTGPLIPISLLVAVFSLVGTMLLCIFANLTQKPKPVSNSLQLLNIRMAAHRRERGRVLLSVFFLVLGIAFLLIGIFMFGAKAVEIPI